MKTRGWVYIIVNKAMKGLIKIGYSNQDPIFRAMDLDNTGAPTKYQVAYDALVDNPYEFEQEMHKLLKERSVGKEWFKYQINWAIGEIRESCPRIYAEKLDLDLIDEILAENNTPWRNPNPSKKYDALPDKEKAGLSEPLEQVIDMPDSILEYQENYKEIRKRWAERNADVFLLWRQMTKEEQTLKAIELMQNMTPEIWRSNEHLISHIIKLNGTIKKMPDMEEYGLLNLEEITPFGSGLIDGLTCNTLWIEIINTLEICLAKDLIDHNSMIEKDMKARSKGK